MYYTQSQSERRFWLIKPQNQILDISTEHMLNWIGISPITSLLSVISSYMKTAFKWLLRFSFFLMFVFSCLTIPLGLMMTWFVHIWDALKDEFLFVRFTILDQFLKLCIIHDSEMTGYYDRIMTMTEYIAQYECQIWSWRISISAASRFSHSYSIISLGFWSAY